MEETEGGWGSKGWMEGRKGGFPMRDEEDEANNDLYICIYLYF